MCGVTDQDVVPCVSMTEKKCAGKTSVLVCGAIIEIIELGLIGLAWDVAAWENLILKPFYVFCLGYYVV
jgi:hypothetical protein